MTERIVVREYYIDAAEDEVLLVETINQLLQKIKRNRERIVCILAEEEVCMIKIRRSPNVP